MPRNVKNSFNAGELSPLMDGRRDFSRYFNGCKILENCIALAQGGAQTRAGFQFIEETKDSTKKTRLIPFIFNAQIAYIIEAGDLYFRFYRDGSRLGAPFELSTPYTQDQLKDLKFTQSADVMYITQGPHQQRKLSRLGDTNWTLTLAENKNGPFLNENVDDSINITPDFIQWATATEYKKNDVVRRNDSSRTIPTYSSQNMNDDAGDAGGNVAIDAGGGLVDLPLAAHGYNPGEYVRIAGSTNYDGDVKVETGTTTNLIRITATFNAETFTGGVTVQRFSVPVDKGANLIGFPATAHGYSEGEFLEIVNTTNYDGVYEIHSSTTTNEIVIAKIGFVIEFLDNSNLLRRIEFYKTNKDHTSGAGNPAPPANTTDWSTALSFTGSNFQLISSSALFNANHVGALWKVVHPRKDNKLTGNYSTVQASDSIAVDKDTTWSLVTAGTHTSVIELQRSYDDGSTWNPVKVYRSVNNRNVSVSGTEDVGGALYRFAITEYTSGNITFDFNIDEFEHRAIVKITEFVSTTTVKATIIRAIGSPISTSNWSEGSWSDHRGWPYDAKFFDERLVYAGNDGCPVELWPSESGDFDNFNAGVLDSDSFTRRLDGDQINQIQWIASFEDILAATAGGIWRIGSSDRSQPMSPTNVTHRKQNSSGAESISPVEVNNSLIYVGYQGGKVFDLIFNDESRGYQTIDLTRLAPHLTEAYGITEIALAKHPEQFIYCLRSDGVILTLSYRREEDLFAWSRFTTDGTFESIATIPGTVEDELYCVVKRTINGTDKRYIERKKPQNHGSNIDDVWQVDSGLDFDGGASVSIASITNANPAHVNSAAHGLVDGEFVKISGALGMNQANDVFQIAFIDINNYTLKHMDTGVAINSLSWGTYTGSGSGKKVAKTFTNASHLEGKEIAMLLDGSPAPKTTVVSGSFTADRFANRAIAGLSFRPILSPTNPDFEGGAIQGNKRRIAKVLVQHVKTLGLKVGTSLDKLNEFKCITDDTLMDTALPLKTGFSLITLSDKWNRDNQLYLVQDQPLPFTIISLIYELEWEPSLS